MTYKAIIEENNTELQAVLNTINELPEVSEGPQGPQGVTFTPSVSADGDISWTNDGDLPNPATVNIKGPKGDTGPQGEKGDTGATGPQGEKGDTGETGAQGPKGDTGETGPTGPQGDTGPQGIQGEKGDTGPEGAQGPKGDAGAQGIQGIPGNDGTDGVTFIPAVAEDGTLSWSNNGGLDNPPAVNIKGPSGASWTKVSYDEEPYYIEALDRHEYYLLDITELAMDLPTTDKYEIWIKLRWATDCEPLFMFFPEIPFIGGEPAWQSGCTYEISVKDGVAVAAQAGEL